jgi:hypothetical protein
MDIANNIRTKNLVNKRILSTSSGKQFVGAFTSSSHYSWPMKRLFTFNPVDALQRIDESSPANA